ncbi:N-6 DNA methylase [Fodinibius sediminis]|uniref:site-specific DNA-methyltransferase (adenine-specific) n=1 Tax=Fodinibius sediminis TaxID=1214077 RepID=A0A521AUU7_9BACT|nr:N-6 DNA methylase [Fodinibius sediminis]SMO38584.1 Type I restriction-modification system, DNA methylase subunit [Fodinibius sediminis]
MSKDFKTDIINVLEDSKRSLTAEEIAQILSKKYDSYKSVSPTKVLMRVREHSDTFTVRGEKIRLKQRKSQKQKTVNEITSKLWNLFSYFRNSNFDNYEIFLSLLLYKRFEDTYSGSSTKNLFNDYLMPLNKLHYVNDSSDLKTAISKNFDKLENNLSQAYEDYFEIFDISQDALNDIEGDQLLNIIHDFSEFNFSKEKFSNKDFSDIYSEITDYLLKTGEGKLHVSIPNEIFSLIGKFIQIEDVKSVYNPVVSEPNFFIKTLKEIFNWKEDIHFAGHVNDKSIYSLALHNFVSLNYRDFNLIKGDSLQENETSNFDLAISQLPFGRRKPKFNENPYYLKYGDSRTAEWYYIQKMLNSVNKNGKVVAITSSSPLTNNSGSKIRKTLVHEGLVEAVIKLPNKVFKNTSVPTFIFILDKGKYHNEIFLADFDQKMDSFSATHFKELSKKAKSHFETHTEIEGFSRFVAAEEVFENRNSLNPSNYIHPELEKVKHFLAGDKEKIVSLKDLVKDRVLGKFRIKKAENKEDGKFETSENWESWHYSSGINCVTVRDLNTQKNFVHLRYAGLEKISYPVEDSKVKKSLISSKAVLVNRIGKSLNPTVFTPDSKNPEILLGNDVVALIPDETKILPEYLHYQITQETTRVQVELNMRGTTVQRLNLRDLLDLKFFVPPIEEQEKQVFEFKQTLLKREESERDYEEKEKVILANMRHSLKNKIGPIKNDFATTKLFLSDLEEKGKGFNWEMPIRPVTGQDKEKVKSVAEVFDRIDRKFEELNDILHKMKSIIDLKKSVLDLEFVKVGQFIKEVFEGLNIDKERTFIKCKGDKIEAPIDRFWFQEAISNLIINAERHGRIKDPKLELFFEISNTEDGNVRIYYANNGKPFPPGFNFDIQYKGFKEKAGKESGTGLGGYLINKVIESHEGSLDRIVGDDTEPSYYNVEMEILIPKRI